MRLSKDDEGAGESASITAQRKMLRAFAKKNHFPVYDEYVDDGISGTTFERPDFKRMLQDIEEKKINMVITKDLSRLGRDYILAGKYTELSRQKYDILPSTTAMIQIVRIPTLCRSKMSSTRCMRDTIITLHSHQRGGHSSVHLFRTVINDPQDKHRLIVDEGFGKNRRKYSGVPQTECCPYRLQRLHERNMCLHQFNIEDL